jgi:hypothetical protein
MSLQPSPAGTPDVPWSPAVERADHLAAWCSCRTGPTASPDGEILVVRTGDDLDVCRTSVRSCAVRTSGSGVVVPRQRRI